MNEGLNKTGENQNWDALYEKYSKLNNQADEIYKKLNEKENRDTQLIGRLDKFLKLDREIDEQIDEISKKIEVWRSDPEKSKATEFIKFLGESEKNLSIKWGKVSSIINEIFSSGKLNDQETNELMKEMEEIRTLQTKLEIDLGFLKPKDEWNK